MHVATTMYGQIHVEASNEGGTTSDVSSAMAKQSTINKAAG